MAVDLNVTSRVTIFGGSGFLGRHIVRAIAKTGARMLIAVRRPHLANYLQPLGGVGQINFVQANVRYPETLVRAAAGSDAVVNLTGILAPSGNQTFEAIHAEGAENAAKAAVEAGVSTMVHISAIGADPDSPAAYGRTKAAGEAAVLRHFPKAVILRPSIVFGPEDDFFNRFAAMARISPALPLIGGGRTKLQPVFVGDVAKAVVAGLEGRARGGHIYELGGPEIVTMEEVMRRVLAYTDRNRMLVNLPFWAASFMAQFLQYMPGAPLTPDQVRMLKDDNVVSEAADEAGRTLEGLGITEVPMQAVVPDYLERFRPRGQFSPRPPAHV